MQRDSHLPTNDLTSTDKSNEEIWKRGNVLCGRTLEDHIERLDEVLASMKNAGIKCKPSKCELSKDSIKYFGRMVDQIQML